MAKRGHENSPAKMQPANDDANKRQRRDSHHEQSQNGGLEASDRASKIHPWPFRIINQSMKRAPVPLSSTIWPRIQRFRPMHQRPRPVLQGPRQPALARFQKRLYEGTDAEFRLKHHPFNIDTFGIKLERGEDESLSATMFGYPSGVNHNLVRKQIRFVTLKCRKKKPTDLLSKAAIAEMLLPFIDLEDPETPSTVYAYGAVGTILLDFVMLDPEAELECTQDRRTGALSWSLIGFDLPWAYYEDECGFRLAFLQYLRDHPRRPYVRLTDAHEADLERTFKDGGAEYVTTLLYVEEQTEEDAREKTWEELPETMLRKLDLGKDDARE